MLVPNILVAVVFISHLAHVLVDLLRCCVVVWPVGIGLEAVCVIVCWDITLATRIATRLS